ncbi:MAG: nucleotidyl transferase AbiEii/AbiGii toxin family protein [Flavihumibacter sp.]
MKAETIWKELVLETTIPQLGLQSTPSLKIKIEIDREPPLGFDTEDLLLLKPFSFYVKCFGLPDLFAGKTHALLFRKWKQRVKGRDWYDFEWYVKKGVPLHLEHFLLRAQETGDYTGKKITEKELKAMLKARMEAVPYDRVRDDVRRFIPDDSRLNIWSASYFADPVNKMKCVPATA